MTEGISPELRQLFGELISAAGKSRERVSSCFIFWSIRIVRTRHGTHFADIQHTVVIVIQEDDSTSQPWLCLQSGSD